eukprot:12961167-Alexandrium_andersonii.AAC.1
MSPLAASFSLPAEAAWQPAPAARWRRPLLAARKAGAAASGEASWNSPELNPTHPHRTGQPSSHKRPELSSC